MSLTNEEMLSGDWAKGPAGTGEASWVYLIGPTTNLKTTMNRLAEKWELKDPQTLVFQIRKGVRFHNKPPVNGREMTAEDVAYSIKRLWTVPRSYHNTAYPGIAESIVATDKWTVTIKAQPGKTGLVFDFASDFSKIVPREVVDKYGDMSDWKNSNGTGPFMLTDYVQGSVATFKKNPDYWMKDPVNPANTLPYLDGVKFFIIPDISTRLAALRTGKIDHFGGWADQAVTWEDAKSLIQTNPELKYSEYFLGRVEGIYMRQDKPELPFKDIRVRRALSMGFDRKAIADSYYGGHADILAWPIPATPEWKHIYTPLDKQPDAIKELYQYNPDKAKQLLAEAGYPKGFKTSIVTTKPYVDLLSILKDYWSKIGVDLEIQVKEAGAYASLVSKGVRGYDVLQSYFNVVEPYKLYNCLKGHPGNYSEVDDQRVVTTYDELLASALDPVKRDAMIKDIAPYLMEKVYWIQMPGPYVYTFWQPWVKGYHGELYVGYVNNYDFATYIWMDLALKEKMTGTK